MQAQTAPRFDASRPQLFGKTPWSALTNPDLPDVQRSILGYIDGFRVIYRESPTVKDIALNLGMHRGRVHRALRALEIAGYVLLPIGRDGRMRPEISFHFKGKASSADHAPMCRAGATHPPMLPTNTEAPARRCRTEEYKSEEKSPNPLTTTTNTVDASKECEPIPAILPGLQALPEREAVPFPAALEPLPAATLTAGQAAFLAGLSAEERTRFDAWPVERQAKALVPHLQGVDPVIARSTRLKLAPPKQEAPVLIPAITVPALLGQIARGDLAGASKAAEWMCRDFGSEKDRRLWGQFSLIVMAVARGTLALEPVVEAYLWATMEDTERRKRGLPPVQNRGALFWRVLKDRSGVNPEKLRSLACGVTERNSRNTEP